MMSLVRLLALALFLSAAAQAEQKQAQISLDPAAVLSKAKEAMGFERAQGKVISAKWISAEEHPYESDRTYPPFFSMMTQGESWYDPQSGINRTSNQVVYPGSGPGRQSVSISDSSNQYFVRDSGASATNLPDPARELNAWLVIWDWAQAKDVRYAGKEEFRDYPRIILARGTASGEQRLYLDEKTGYPVKLEYEEPHYLWGQRKIQCLFSNWQQAGTIFTANSSFRIADGEVETSKTVGDVTILEQASAPSMTVPEGATHPTDARPVFLRPTPPRVIDVSATTKILTNPGYNEAVTLVGDQVYLFDATQGEERARLDHEIIRRLYPTAKQINLVVTDLAWPHVAGLRYWVANGATVISHKASRRFLQQILDRHWTRSPDLYEGSRKNVKFKFVGVDVPEQFSAGKILVSPIDGIGSEVALVAFVSDDNFLWASDYLQTLSTPTMYATEVIHAAQRAGMHPQRVAAEHMRIEDWQKVVEAQDLKEKR